MSNKNKNRSRGNAGGMTIHKPATYSEYQKLHQRLTANRYIALDVLRPGPVREVSLAVSDAANAGAQDMATCMGAGTWSNGPLAKVAWSFDSRDDTVVGVNGKDGKPLGLGYVKWGAGNNIPSVIPPLAMTSPYTAAPLRYTADLITGLGVRLMYQLPDGTLCEYKNAGEKLRDEVDGLTSDANDSIGEVIAPVIPGATKNQEQESPALKRARQRYEAWQRSWFGYDETGDDGVITHVPGAKEFLEENNLDLHFSQCMQDHTMLDIFFPTVGLQRGRRGKWNPKVVRVGFFPASIVRMERKDLFYYSNHCYVSDQWRTLGATQATALGADKQQIVMYPAAQPQNMLAKLRDIVAQNQRTRINARPTWVVCPTFYPSGNKPYYPQPAWWSIFTSKAFDFSATILYDKYKARENSTTWGRIIYISLDYLDQVFSDKGYQGDEEKQQEFIDQLDQNVEQFLRHRDNHGKTMRQWMWLGQDGKEHKNVEIVDVTETTSADAKAGKDELELSTSPIFLALQVDPRLVGVPMVAASNGGTALREMHLLKQQQLNVHQRLYLRFLNNVAAFNEWAGAEWHIVQQTLTTLDNSKTGTVETIAGERA